MRLSTDLRQQIVDARQLVLRIKRRLDTARYDAENYEKDYLAALEELGRLESATLPDALRSQGESK